MDVKFLAALSSAVVTLTAGAAVRPAAGPIALDGRLDEAAWAQADWESGFRRLAREAKRDGRTPRSDTSFAVLCDAECLYLGVRCAEPDLAALKAREPAGPWSARTDSVEFDFIPDGGKLEYYQFLVTYGGDRFSMYRAEGGNIAPDPYSPEWEARVGEDADGWTIEMRLPLAAFYMTRQSIWNGTWRINLARSNPSDGRTSWSDLRSSFLELANYRTMGGFPKRRPEEDVWVKGVLPETKAKADGRIVGSLEFTVYAAKPGRATLESTFTQPLDVTLKTGDNVFRTEAAFPENGRHPCEVRLKRAGEQVVLKRFYPVTVDYQPIRLKLTTPAYRGNFYPGQCADKVEGTVSAGTAEVRAVLEGPGFGRRETVVENGRFRFDTTGFGYGEAKLTVTAGADTLVRRILRIRQPETGHVSWIENGHLVVDGRPVFRRNMYAEYYRGGTAFRERYDADDLHQTRDIRRAAIIEPGRLVRGIERKEATKDVRPSDILFEKLDRAIAEGLANTNGVYYYICDEPECRSISPVYLKYVYDYVCEKDPYHAIICGTRAGRRYLDVADWFETHPYFNAHLNEEGKRVYYRDFNTLGAYVDAFRPDEHPDKCVGCMPTCFGSSGCIYPTFREYTMHVWNFLIHGAKTFFPYAYHDLGDCASLYEGVRFTNESVERLEGFFLFGTRTVLAVNGDYEAAVWEKDGRRLLAVANCLQSEQTVDGAKFPSGSWFEFRGARTFRTPAKLKLAPLEALVLTSERMDAGLVPYEAAEKKVEAAEATRLGRDNQLMALYRRGEVDVISSSSAVSRKLFDGTRGNLAWQARQERTPFMELSFPKLTPTFTRLAVYGWRLRDMKVKARIDGDWKELVPAKRDSAEFHEILEFGETVRTVKLRLEFPQKQVEVYEIELPGTCVAQSAASGVRDRGESVSLGEVKTSENQTVSWTRPEGYDYLTFDFAEPQRIATKAYTAWGVSQPKRLSLFSAVTTPLAGRYTLRLPPSAGRKEPYLWRTRNLALDIRDVRFAKEPLDRVDFTEKDGTYAIRLTLAAPCEDVTCKFLTDVGRGPSALSVNGRSFCDLKPIDATRRVWGAEIPVTRIDAAVPERFKKEKYRPFVKVTALGGGLEMPIIANCIKE